jgi:hypothetical protein
MTARALGTSHRVVSGHPVAVFLVIAFAVPWALWLLRSATGIDSIAPGACSESALRCS